MQRYQQIGIFGATGGVGEALARLLLQRSDAVVVLIGRSAARLAATQAALQAAPGRLRVAVADAVDAASMQAAFDKLDLVVNATTAMERSPRIAGVCVDRGCDYVELCLSRSLEPLAARAEAAGVMLLDQAGFHPGLLAPLVRFGAQGFDRVDAARIFMSMDVDFREASSTLELVDAAARGFGALVQDGVWRRATWRDQARHDFGGATGKKDCVPLEMIEVREVAAELGLRDAGIYASGFNFVVDWFIFPLVMLIQMIRPGALRMPLARLLFWGLRTFSPAGRSVRLALELQGQAAGAPRQTVWRLEHTDAYLFTVAPILAALWQLDDGSARRPGLQMMGMAVDAARLFADLDALGLRPVQVAGPRR